MQWHDECFDSRSEELHKYPSRILLLRAGDEIDSGYYARRDIDLAAERVTRHGEVDYGDDRKGGGRRRRREAEEDSVRQAAAGEDVAVQRLMGAALAKQSATQRHPSAAGSVTRRALSDTVKACNSLAMSALGRGETSRCKGLLVRALEIASGAVAREQDQRGVARGRGGGGSGGIPSLQVLTLNNMACLHRRLGEPKQALGLLRRAADVGRRGGSSEHLDVTHLNACAVLSELGWHEEALEHARSAVFHGQEREEMGTQPLDDVDCSDDKARSGADKSRRARLATLAVSYYNLAVELEYTHRFEACLRWYREAVKLARDPDVRNEELVKTFQRAYAGARKKHPIAQLRSAGSRKALGETPLTRSTGGRASGASLGSSSPSRGRCDQFALSVVNIEDNHHQVMSQESLAGEGDLRGRRGPLEVLGDLSGSKKNVGLPRLGKIEKQQSVSDERRSTADGVWNRSRAEKALQPSASPQSNVGGTRLLRQHYNRTSGRQDIPAARARCLSPSECVGCAGEAGRGSSVQRPEPRKRPASAGVPTDREPRQVQLGKAPYAATIPEVSVPSFGPPWHMPVAGKASTSRCNSQREVVPEEPTTRGGYSHRRRSLNFRRPKSAHPRLDEGNRRPDAVPDVDARGCGGGGDKSFSPMRSRSARALRDPASWSALSTSGGGAGECRSPEQRRVSRVEPGSSNVSGRLKGTSDRRCNRVTTKLRRKRGGSSTIHARNRGDWDKHPESSSSPTSPPPVASGAISRRRKRLSMEVARAVSYSANGPIRREMRALENGGEPLGDHVVPDEFFVKPQSPRNSLDSWAQEHFEGVSRLDNGRDGKMYLDPELQEADEPLAYSRVEGNQSGEYVPEIAGVHGSGAIQQGAPWSKTEAAAVDGGTAKIPTGAKAAAYPLMEPTRRTDAERVIRRGGLRAAIRRRPVPREHYDGADDVDNDRQEVDQDYMAWNGRATSSTAEMVPPKGGGLRGQALGMTDPDASEEEEEERGRYITASSVALLEQDRHNSITTTQERRDPSRTAQDRRTLAGSAIRVWVAHALLARRLRRSRRFSDLKLQWKYEVHRIAATRIQSVMRGVRSRQELERAARAAIEIQRVTRGRRGCLAAKRLLAQKRLEKRQETSRDSKRLLRGHRDRRRIARERQIVWEEAIVYNGAAALIQGFCLRHRHAVSTLQVNDETQSEEKKSNEATKSATPTGSPALSTPSPRGRSADLAGAISAPSTANLWSSLSSSQVVGSGTSSVLDAQPTTPDAPPTQATSKASAPQQPWRPTEAEVSSLYILWGAFTALLAARATRRVVKQRLVSALLAPAAATLATFSRVYQSASTRGLEVSSLSSPAVSLTAPPDPTRFQCARSLRRELAAASRRLAAVARVHAESLLAAQSAAAEVVGGLSREKREAAAEHAGDAVPEAVQDCWKFLCSSDGLLADEDKDKDGLKEKLTDVLSDTLQDLLADLGFTSSQASSTPLLFPVERSVEHVECSDGVSRARPNRRSQHILETLPEMFARALASSAAGTLLSQSDVSDIMDGVTDDFDDAEHASLVAEAYGILLLAAPPDCGEEERDANLTPGENVDGPPREATLEPCRSGPRLQPLHCCLRAHERMDVLRSIFGKIDATADELTRAMEWSSRRHGRCDGRANRGAGERTEFCAESSRSQPCYDKQKYLIRSMTDGLWELALSVSPFPMEDKQYCYPNQGEEKESSTKTARASVPETMASRRNP